MGSLPLLVLDMNPNKDYNACVGVSEYINGLLMEVSEEYKEDYVELLYDEYLEAMYGTDPRFYGPDYDES